MSKRKEYLKELLKKRSSVPLVREVVKPVDMYQPRIKNERLKTGNEKEGTPKELIQSKIGVGRKIVEGTNKKSKRIKAKKMKQFATYVTEKSYRKLKLIAVSEDRKIYDIIQEAIDNYIETKSG